MGTHTVTAEVEAMEGVTVVAPRPEEMAQQVVAARQQVVVAEQQVAAAVVVAVVVAAGRDESISSELVA
jgi:hypothetical protein